MYASEKLHVLISLLFNSVNIHGYLPTRLMETIIVPTVKDNKGVLTDKNNYRPIALTCVASKLGNFIRARSARHKMKIL